MTDGAPPRAPPPTLPDDAALDAALGVLTTRDPALARAWVATGRFPVRRRPAGPEGLLRIVVGQQVSVAAADSIWRKVAEVAEPARLLAATDEDLRARGLSRPKVAACRAVARALLDGSLDLAAVAAAPDDQAGAMLVRVHGVGRWTAEVYLMFALGRADVWPAGDLALRAALHHLHGLPERPDIALADALGAPWAPYRAAAAQLLWRYYGVIRAPGAPPRPVGG